MAQERFRSIPPANLHKTLRMRTEGYTSAAARVVPSIVERWDMARTAADILVETLEDWGVDTVFGLPGDGINGVMEALRRAKDERVQGVIALRANG